MISRDDVFFLAIAFTSEFGIGVLFLLFELRDIARAIREKK